MREKVYNVISLEFSGTKLDKLVHCPSFVTEMDWINCHWPKKLKVARQAQDTAMSYPQASSVYVCAEGG